MKNLTQKMKAEMFDTVLGMIGTVCHHLYSDAEMQGGFKKAAEKRGDIEDAKRNEATELAYLISQITIEEALMDVLDAEKHYPHFDATCLRTR